MISKYIRYIKEHKSFYWLFGFLASGLLYFSMKFTPMEFHFVHIPLDDKIPFLPIFIIPYIIWYLYVPIPMIYLYFKDEEAFKKQAITFFSGMLITFIFFAIYPTQISFRPTAEGKGILLWLCRIIYANDTPPANAFPSLHCYEALIIHLTTFAWGPLKNNKPLRIASFVLMALICASTVFVKQHSAIDIIGGCGLAVFVFLSAELFLKIRGNKCVKNSAV